MSNPWNINSYPSTNTQATASQAAPASGKTTGMVVRLRALMVTLSAGASPSSITKFVVRDGDSGSGTILLAGSLSVGADFGQSERLTGIDIRASLGNAITVEFTGAGGSATQESVWAQGDIVPVGYPMGQN